MPVTSIKPADLRRMLDDGKEIAVLDTREEGVFSRDGHLLLASSMPLSHLEMRVAALLPCKSVRVVVCDANEGLAQIAAVRLSGFGYTNVMLLEGGTAAWAAAGYRLYTGVYVPSKTFGEYIFHHDHTPEVTPDELAAWQKEKRDMVIFDSRPLEEFARGSIPGAIDCPSAELVYRVPGLVQSEKTTVVVNCGGRTRSIIGAQALINAGLANRVYAMKDGTQGWHLAGHKLDHGMTAHAPMPSAAGAELAKAAAKNVAQRFGVRTIDKKQLQAFQADKERTVYLIDVRSPDEFIAGHLPGSVSAPGGQLVQSTDAYLGVRRSIAVLIDDNAVRATTTAAWLLQMGWQDVYVMNGALEGVTLERGPAPVAVYGLDGAKPATVSAQELKGLLDAKQAAVADLASTLRYPEGHIPGAWQVVRSRLREDLAAIPGDGLLVFTAPDERLARLTATDAAKLTSRPVKVLHGGTGAWRAAGYAMEKGSTHLTGPADDVRYRAMDHTTNVEAEINKYLSWEVDLVNATETDTDFGFRRFA